MGSNWRQAKRTEERERWEYFCGGKAPHHRRRLGWGSLLHWKPAENFPEGWKLDVGLRKPEVSAGATA